MHRKRTLFTAISLVILVALLLSACFGKEKVKLSEMEDAELIQALTEFGVAIPKDMKNIDGIRRTIAELEEDALHRPPVVSNPVIINFYEDLRSFVIFYEPNKD